MTGTLTAIVVIFRLVITDWTSGPWCDGSVIGSGTIASIGPLLTSSGSAALRTSTALALETPKF